MEGYHANGKILLTSEFMILHGSKALAAPLNKGQALHLTTKSKPGHLHWIASFNDKIWFETVISLENFSIITTTSRDKSINLINILVNAKKINPAFKTHLNNADIITKLEFDPSFGFGSSSTLTSLIAQWAEIDPLQLHFSISRGSGYDVACARAASPILYQVINEMPVIEYVDFNPPFIDNMWLVYLGRKQVSDNSVKTFLNNYAKNQEDIDFFTKLTSQFHQAGTYEELGKIITIHEEKLSRILGVQAIKQSRFPDLEGYVKSLGAWGGDFALLMSEWSEQRISEYLIKKGINYWFHYKDITL